MSDYFWIFDSLMILENKKVKAQLDSAIDALYLKQKDEIFDLSSIKKRKGVSND